MQDKSNETLCNFMTNEIAELCLTVLFNEQGVANQIKFCNFVHDIKTLLV